MAKETLADVFNVAGAKIDFVTHDARRTLRRFAKRYPLEVTLSDNENVARFSTEDVDFHIRADQNENLNIVFIGTITSYCPERVLFSTDYKDTFDEVLAALIEGVKALD